MPEHPLDVPKILSIYLQISQYPILARHIRRHMREELYRHGVLSRERLEVEVREKAVLSQKREGMVNPISEENDNMWEERMQQIRDHLTDFYFAHNLPIELFEDLIEKVLADRHVRHPESRIRFFNPELAPLELLIDQLSRYERLPLEQREPLRPLFDEMAAVLVKAGISDHPRFVRIAKNWFTAEDFELIRSRLIGSGKIGGKAGGLLLAWRILRSSAPDLAGQMTVPRSSFIGANVFHEFLAANHLQYFNQKFKSLDQNRAEYPRIQEEFQRGALPETVEDSLRKLLCEAGKAPMVVRSSSLLEDGIGTAFAGKYISIICPNQGSPEENLCALSEAIRRVYASVYAPDALAYRRRMDLLECDERMAVLIQEVQGLTYRNYLFPALAGVAFSYSPIVWNPRLRREEGFCRIVMGLGTRAVNRVAEDYPRLVTLSHPALRPETTPAEVRRYSQKTADVVDLRSAVLASVPVTELLNSDFPALPWLASIDQGDTVMPIFSLGPHISSDCMILTFDNLLQKTGFVDLLKGVLSTLSRQYDEPVDVEFAATLDPSSNPPKITLHLLQCRVQTGIREGSACKIPKGIDPEDKFFVATRVVPQGAVQQVQYVCFIDPDAYGRLERGEDRKAVADIVGRLNKVLENQAFILIGPGRWGSVDPLLGVPVTYADIFNTKVLVELAVEQQGAVPEPSYGTHFFQDLVEARIYPVGLYPDQPGDLFRGDWLLRARNWIEDLTPGISGPKDCVRLVNIPGEFGGRKLDIVMDGETAVAYLTQSNGDGHAGNHG
ncbi:MAG: PEP/pyruvate-binding domain-containing protein [Anaerolineales bacterium]